MDNVSTGAADGSTKSVSVLIVDDQMPFRAVARTVIGMTAGFEVTSEAESGEDAVAQSTPMGRIGAPADCGAAALFLCSDHASWVTGMDFVIDGGSMVGGAAVRRAPDGAGSQIIQNLRDAANAT